MSLNDTKATVLIVDDVPANIQLLAQLLKSDYAIKVATNGKRCLELAAATPPDLILLDVIMPDMDGYEVCKRLQSNAQTSHVPIIFLTGKDQAEDEEKGFELGAVDYIKRPFIPAIIEARVRSHITIKQQRDLLEQMAMHDQLTGLYNRHYLHDIFPKKFTKAHRHHYPLSMAVIDLDHFKNINDTHGHHIGDEVLIKVAKLIDASCRSEDVASRYGGEEFIVLFDHCNLSDCVEKANNLRKKIAELSPCDIPLTASFGVSEIDVSDSEDFDRLFERADQAVYQAKSLGRNRVEARAP